MTLTDTSAGARSFGGATKTYRRLSNGQFSLLLLAPALVLLALTVVYPLARGVYLSFRAHSLVNPTMNGFVGLDNYRTLLSSSAYRDVWTTTLIFVAASVAGQFLLGFLTALVLNNRHLKRPGLFRGLLLVPWIVPTVVTSLLWKWIYNQQYGIFNYVLDRLGVISGFKPWIGDPDLALFSVVLANVWKGFPFHMIVLLAALQTIPSDVVEAATIDGATAIQRFLHIVLPYMRYIIMIDLLISIIWTFQNFTLIWTMTEGGPGNSTTTLAINIYRTSFQGFDMGLGAAIGTLWLIGLLAFSVVFVRLVGGGERTKFE
jgi:multiple sugar transport system permease protein